ncbi:MAG: hypothetical protein N3A63_01920 [Bacteroidetes bacterium]|nr:hypothetical protein [Bacteroidota bacterium]
MKTHLLLLIFVGGLLFTFTSFAQLGDGMREGFLLGLGGVLGSSSIEYRSGNSESASSYGAQVYLGYGFTEQSILAFRFRWTWIDTDSPYQGLTWTADYRHFLVQNSGVYVNVGFGPAMSIPEFGDPKSGTVLYGGIGYEIAKYVFFTFDISSISLSDGLSGSSVLFSISFLKY